MSATTRIELAAAASVLTQLREHFAEHGTVSGDDRTFDARFDIGSAAAELTGDAIVFRVSASDDTSLAFMQWSVAEHVHEYADGEMPEIVWAGGTRPGTALPYFREMTVVGSRQVTPKVRRLTLKGRELSRFAENGMHIRLLLPPRPGIVPVWPLMAEDGRQQWPEGERPIHRVYTLRRIDVAAGEVDIDFVLHDHDGGEGAGKDTCAGARFALEAAPGTVVGMTGPGGGDLKPAASYVFAGDETGLPAIARMIEELPAGVRARAFIEIADDAERQPIASKAEVDISWLPRDGTAAGCADFLPQAIAGLPAIGADEDLFLWVGCEQKAARAIRRHLKTERRLDRKKFLVAAYWIRGVAGETYDGND